MDKIKHLSIRGKNLSIMEYLKAKAAVVRLVKEVLKTNGQAIIKINVED